MTMMIISVVTHLVQMLGRMLAMMMQMLVRMVWMMMISLAKVVEGSVAQKQGGILPNDQVIEVTYIIIFTVIIGIIRIVIMIVTIFFMIITGRRTSPLWILQSGLTSIAKMI